MTKKPLQQNEPQKPKRILPGNKSLAEALRKLEIATSYSRYGGSNVILNAVREAQVDIIKICRTDGHLHELKIQGIGDETKLKLTSIIKNGLDATVQAQTNTDHTTFSRTIGAKATRDDQD